MAADNLAKLGCSQVGRNLDIKAKELLQMEEMKKLVEILEKDKEHEENPRSGCGREEEVGQQRWEVEMSDIIHTSARIEICSGCGGRGQQEGQVEGQGKEGESPKRRQVELRRVGREEGMGASWRAGRMMPASGRIMEKDSW